MAAGKVDPKVRMYKICVQFQGSSTLELLVGEKKKKNQYHSLSKSSWFSLSPALLFLTLPLGLAAPASCLGPCLQPLNCSVGIFHSDVLRDHHPPPVFSLFLTGLLQILVSLLRRDGSSSGLGLHPTGVQGPQASWRTLDSQSSSCIPSGKLDFSSEPQLSSPSQTKPGI